MQRIAYHTDEDEKRNGLEGFKYAPDCTKIKLYLKWKETFDKI